MSVHEHELVPENPKDGDRFECWCGDRFEFVLLDDGRPGEWVSV